MHDTLYRKVSASASAARCDKTRRADPRAALSFFRDEVPILLAKSGSWFRVAAEVCALRVYKIPLLCSKASDNVLHFFMSHLSSLW